jgi:WD40 repeat protein
MRSDELRQAIESPASEMALYFEPANLVDRLIDEVGQMPGALPLLSFTLSELYIKLKEKWSGESSDRALTIDASFDKEGGVAGSLTRRANEEYEKLGEKLGEAAQQTMRRVMLRMLTLEGGETARRRVPESELVYPTQEESDRVKHVVAQLVEARLLVKGQLETGEPYVEPAHDFLVRGWDRLRSWIEEEQENLALMQRLIPAVIDWDKNGRLPEFLWIRDPRLAILEDISLDLDSWLNRLETEFVQHSVEQKQNELEEAEERLIDSEERRVNAELREKAIKVEKSLTRHPQESLEHTIQLVGDNLEKLSDQLIDEAQTTLRTVMETFLVPNILYGHKTPIKAIAISDDGETIVSSSGDVICLWTPQGIQLGQPVTLSSGHLIDTIAISANGQRIVTVGKNDCVRLWNRQGKQLAKLEHLGFHNYAAISADGQTLLTGSKNKILRLWDLNGEPVETFQAATYTADAIAMSANNQTIVLGGENDKICLWNPQGKPLGKPLRLGLANRIDAVAISADGQTVAGVSAGGGVHLWDSQGNLLAKLQPSSQHNAIAISANGQMIVTGGRSETLRLWNRKGDLLRELKHRVAVTSVALSADGQTIVVGSQDGTVWVWNQQHHQIAEFSHHSFSHVAVSANGQTIVSAYPGETVRLGDGTIRQPGGMIYVWDRQGNQLKEFQSHKHGFKALAVSPDGQIIATGGQYGLIRLWDCQGKELATFQGSQASINAIAISTDRQMVVSGSEDGIVRVWDIETNGCIECLGHTGQLTTVAISADGQTIVSAGGDHIVRLWNRQGIQLAESLPHEGWIAFVATNADGQIVASAQRNNVVRLWNQQGQLIREFREHSAPIASVALSADGQIILTGDDDGTMLLWNQRGEQLGEWRHTDPVRIVAISIDNQTLLSASGNTIRLWYGGWVTWLKTCCDRLAYYLISKNPEISLMEGVCKLCVVHAWNPANLMSLFLRQGKSEAESRQLTVTFLVMKVRKFARLGKIEEAISAYTEAQKFNDNKIPIDACGELAWLGSLHGYATNPNTQTIIQRACEEAITSEPNVAAWRDSRGLFRALTGDFSGAIEDFQVVVAKTTNVRNRLQRKRWVKALYNRVNPFTSEEIETLIRQQKIADAFDN